MIITDEAQLLRPCQEVDLNEGFKTIRRLELELESYHPRGMGLAANQIGLLKKVCILRIPNDDINNPATFGHNLINPVILEKKNPVIVKNEGCLSYPGEMVETLRYHEVLAKDALHPLGRSFSGWTAICCQHEVDHLNGVTMKMRKYKNVGDNNKCPCDSGLKFKKCCKKELKKTKRTME